VLDVSLGVPDLLVQGVLLGFVARVRCHIRGDRLRQQLLALRDWVTPTPSMCSSQRG